VNPIPGIQTPSFQSISVVKDVQMSASKNATNTTKTENVSGARGDERRIPQFIQYRLTEDETSQAKNAAETFADIGEIFEQMINEGYKVSASHDGYGGGCQVFMTPSGKEGVNIGYTLTARAPTLLAAVAVLCWKHYTLFSQDWPKDQGEHKGAAWG
jgi:hypothetical protein